MSLFIPLRTVKRYRGNKAPEASGEHGRKEVTSSRSTKAVSSGRNRGEQRGPLRPGTAGLGGNLED